MKAAQINEYGDPSVIKINELDKPSADQGQVLIEVYASSLNPFDTVLRQGVYKDKIPLKFPATLGGDISGIITEVGEAVNDFIPGDKVYGQANVVAGNSGAFAEYAVTSARQIAEIPSNLDLLEAGSVPLVGLSALQALTKHIKLQTGQKILIHGGAGGIGTVAIQIAKHLGAEVVTTASGDNIDFVKSLGADQVIDYKSEDFTAALSDLDAVFDTVGGDDFDKSLSLLKSGGIAVSMAAQANEEKAAELGVTALSQNTKVDTEILNELSELIESGVITIHIEKVYPLDEIQEAFTARENNSVRGKIAIQIRK